MPKSKNSSSNQRTSTTRLDERRIPITGAKPPMPEVKPLKTAQSGESGQKSTK